MAPVEPFFWLVPTNHTLALASRLPKWGLPWGTPEGRRKIKGLPNSDLPLEYFQQTHWRALQHVVIHELARHPLRASHADVARMCIVAAPPQGRCEDWDKLCLPQQTLVVVEQDAEMDDYNVRLCPTLWRDCKVTTEHLLRVVGSPPVIARPRLSKCNALSVPWLSHARSPLAASQMATKNVRIAFAAAVKGHNMAKRFGHQQWRQELRDACAALHDPLVCHKMYQSLAGGQAKLAVQLYSRSVFCLQPPGDTITRSGIVDAISVGCIPVLFHPAQLKLWPWHWNASQVAMFFDFTRPRRNATATLSALAALPEEQVSRMQASVRDVARRLYYRGELGRPRPSEPYQRDAIDVLVDGLSTLAQRRNIP
jgi:hypothetical protein